MERLHNGGQETAELPTEHQDQHFHVFGLKTQALIDSNCVGCCCNVCVLMFNVFPCWADVACALGKVSPNRLNVRFPPQICIFIACLDYRKIMRSSELFGEWCHNKSHHHQYHCYWVTPVYRGHFMFLYRCRRSSSTQEQRYPPPLPLGATAPPTCGRRTSDPGLGVTTQEQEYPLRKLPEIRDIHLIAGYL